MTPIPVQLVPDEYTGTSLYHAFHWLSARFIQLEVALQIPFDEVNFLEPAFIFTFAWSWFAWVLEGTHHYHSCLALVFCADSDSAGSLPINTASVQWTGLSGEELEHQNDLSEMSWTLNLLAKLANANPERFVLEAMTSHQTSDIDLIRLLSQLIDTLFGYSDSSSALGDFSSAIIGSKHAGHPPPQEAEVEACVRWH